MKGFKKALAVLLSALMVILSTPLSAMAIPSPNNPDGKFSTDDDIEVVFYLFDYDGRNAWGYESSTAGKEITDIHSLDKSDLASGDDGTFAIAVAIKNVDQIGGGYMFGWTYDTSKVLPAYYKSNTNIQTGLEYGNSALLADCSEYSENGQTLLDGGSSAAQRGDPILYSIGVCKDFDCIQKTDLSWGDDPENCTYDGYIVNVYGFQLVDPDTPIDITEVFKPQGTTTYSQIETVASNFDKYVYMYDSVFPAGTNMGKKAQDCGYTTYALPQWGITGPSTEPTEVTYTYHFANGDTQQVPAAAGEAPVAPENSANSAAVSNNDGTHTYNTYSWPAWVDGTTDYTEVATPVTEACDMQKTADAVAPTHTTAGKTQVDTCSVCGYQTGGVEVPAEGHSWVEESRTPATCVATGEVKYTCSCGETMTETLPIDPENHANVVTDEAVAATCTKTGLTEGSHCAACDTVIVAQTETPIDPSNHTNVVTDAAVAATCTEAGLTEGSHCADCDTVIVAQETIPALGHDYQITASTDATCVTPGSVTYTCTRCGDSYTDEGVLDPTKHEGEIVSADNAVAPTREKDGKEADMICSACHAVVEAGAVIPALGVQITVEPNELGTTTLNGEATTGEAQKVAYKSNYTLAATPNEGAEFVGWQVNGKLVSTDATYTTAAYADLTYVPVFAEKADDFTVTFVDQFNMVLGTYTSSEVAALEAMPSTYNYLGYTFADWSMTLEEVKALDTNAIVTANYTKDSALTYTVSAPGCTITVGGTVYNDTAEVKFDQAVTVAPVDGTATAWTVNGNNAAYGAEYTFYVTSDVNVAYTSDEVTAAPTVAAVDVTAVNDSDVRFLATRNVPADYKLIESGFLYGKDFDNAESDLDLGNANNGECYIIKNSNTANDGQFALTLTVTSQTGVVYARAYVIAADAEGNTAVYYADVQSFDYNA